MDSSFGMKEFYDVVLKSDYPLTIGGKSYEAGEVLCRFSNIQIARINERKEDTVARGGQDNAALVHWNDTQNVTLSFQQGVFSSRQIGFFWNGNLSSMSAVTVTMHQTDDTDLDKQIELKYVPTGTIYVYNSNGQKLTDYTISGKVLTFASSYQNVEIDYQYECSGASTVLTIARPLVNGFLRLEGKTRLKDDQTGAVSTGYLVIPKLRLKTGLSIQIGQNASPMTASFYGEGEVGEWNGQKTAMSLSILPSDVDSDI